jgi:8-hydroxy-5-deazaflavin:NADPH oxidoreductase
MKVGILGSGIVGQVLGSGFVKHGHQVMMGTREPETKEVGEWLNKTVGASAGSFADAARFGELLVLVVLGRIADKVIELAGRENFTGKTVIDATNPLADAPPVSGVLGYTTGPNDSLGEKIQSLLPQAHVVKAFNSVGNTRMVNPHFEQGVPTMFMCGDDAAAKAQVGEIIRQFGWEPLDCGGIVAARALEPLCMLWCIPGFLRNQWTHAFKVLTH